MSNSIDIKLRVAFRVEGNMWNAYVADLHTMDGAVLIGSIGMGAVASSKRHKAMFMELMQDVLSDFVRETTGFTPTWNEPERAPESERAGRA